MTNEQWPYGTGPPEYDAYPLLNEALLREYWESAVTNDDRPEELASSRARGPAGQVRKPGGGGGR